MAGRAGTRVAARPRRRAWLDAAACAPDPAWTTEHRPDSRTMARLQGVCAGCPVIRECRRYALEEGASGGVYAGVWMPQRAGGPVWHAARHRLVVGVMDDPPRHRPRRETVWQRRRRLRMFRSLQ